MDDGYFMGVSCESAIGRRGSIWHRPALWSAVACALVLATAGYRGLVHPRMHDGLDEDESMTLAYYTWMGTDGQGFPRPVDLNHPPKPDLRELGIGVFCSLGRWPEPNNHILNSLLANFTLALPGDKLVNLRLPALVGAAVFAAALAGLLLGRAGWRWAAPLGLLLAFGCPYVQYYSQQSRGYTWMLALQVLLLAGLGRLGRRPRSACWGVLCAGIAILSFMNMVNMAADWLLPVYLTFLAFPRLLLRRGTAVPAVCTTGVSPVGSPSSDRDSIHSHDGGGGHGFATANLACGGQDARATEAEDARALRKNLLLQVIAVAAVGLVFLIDRLPFVISSMRQYGEPWTGLGEFAARWTEILRYLFPSTAWMVLFFCGLAGAVLSWREPRMRAVLASCLASILVSVVHFLASGRFPYLRGCGFLLPLVLVGAAGLVESVLKLPFLRRKPLACSAWAGLMVLGVACVSSWAVPRPSTQEHDRLARLFQGARPTGGGSVVQIAGLHLAAQPPGWSAWTDAKIDQFKPPLYLGVVKQAGAEAPTFFADGEPGKGVSQRPPWDPLAWPSLAMDKTLEDFRVGLLAGKLIPCPPEGLGEGDHGVFFWYVDAESVAISPDKLHDLLAEHGLRYHVIKKRLYVKMLVFKRVWLVVLYSSSPPEFQRVMAAYRAGRQQFGCSLWAFLPDRPQGADRRR